MSLDIHFKKKGVDYLGIQNRIEQLQSKVIELQNEIEQLESQCADAEICSYNITHNLAEMAKEAGIYGVLWDLESMNIDTAKDMIPILEIGILELEASPNKYKEFNPSNGWGDYEGLVQFVKSILKECKKYPDASVRCFS